MKTYYVVCILCIQQSLLHGQCELMDYASMTPNDTVGASIYGALSCLIKDQTEVAPIASMVDDNPRDPRVSPMASLLCYVRFRYPPLNPYLIDCMYEGRFSLYDIPSYASVLVGRELRPGNPVGRLHLGCTVGTSTRRVPAVPGHTVSSEFGNYETIFQWGPKLIFVMDQWNIRIGAEARFDTHYRYTTGILVVHKQVMAEGAQRIFLGIKSGQYFGVVATYFYKSCMVQGEVYPEPTKNLEKQFGYRKQTIVNLTIGIGIQ